MASPHSILFPKLRIVDRHLRLWKPLSRLIKQSAQIVDLHIEQRESDGIVILDLKGRLVLGPADVALRQHLQALRDAGQTNVALNLKHVADVDSSALGTLIFSSMKFHEAGGRMVLFNLSPSHAEMSNAVKLSTDFEIYPDEVAALNSFYPDRIVPSYDILEFVEEQEQKRQASDLEAGKKHNGQESRESQEVPK